MAYAWLKGAFVSQLPIMGCNVLSSRPSHVFFVVVVRRNLLLRSFCLYLVGSISSYLASFVCRIAAITTSEPLDQYNDQAMALMHAFCWRCFNLDSVVNIYLNKNILLASANCFRT